MTDEFDIDPRTLERDFRTEDVIHRLAEEFVEYVRDEAGHTLTADTLTPDVIDDVADTLYHDGFDPWDDDNDADVWIFAHPEPFYDLQDEIEVFLRAASQPQAPDTVNYKGMPVYGDPSLPETLAMAVHADAVAPPPEFTSRRPWIVRHPDAVVAIELEGYADD